MNSRSSNSSHRLQLRLISEDSIKIFINHITRADFYLNARTNFYNMSEIPRLYKGLKLDSFLSKSRQCVRSHAKILIRPYTDFPKNADFRTKITRNCSGSMWKLRFDLSGTHRKYVYRWRSRLIFSCEYRLPQICHIDNRLIGNSKFLTKFAWTVH